MDRKIAAGYFGLLSVLGLVLAHSVGDSKNVMRLYAILLSASSVGFVGYWTSKSKIAILSCRSMVMIAPIWFLYLEGIFVKGDCWLLPAYASIGALSYCAFFLAIFNLFYFVKPSAAILRVHDKLFLREIPPALLPSLGIVLTAVTVLVVFARYDFDWDATTKPYLAGRSGGSGLIKRGGIGGFEVFLQPLEFMASSVPTVAALAWVAFGRERRAGIFPKFAVSVCALFLIFVMFLGGSRGGLAVYLAGPGSLWILFGPRLGKTAFTAVTAILFTLLIGVWQYQVLHRNNLITGRGGLSGMISQTSFDVTETHRDNNLYLFALNYMYRPEPFAYDGLKEFYVLVVNPIPRAIWPNKPKGIQEDARTFRIATGPPTLGPIPIGTASLSFSIIGDGFQMLHYYGVALYAVIFGLVGSAWDYIGQRRMLSSKLYFILNASWMFWFLWGFRAAFAFVTGMYAVWGAYLFCFFAGRFGIAIRKNQKHRKQVDAQGSLQNGTSSESVAGESFESA